jgi:ADP-L-glycero-D-manno-heptose 6-epimerase
MTDRFVVVTGAAGFIGSNIARALAGDGCRVVACDRLRQGVKWRNISDVILEDIVVPEALPDWLSRHIDQVELIVHMGAVSATTETDVDRIIRENVRFTLNLWEWCTENQVPFIYASSAATYGDGRAGFDDNDHPDALARLRPLNAYGWSKHMVDRRFVADRTAGRPTPPLWVGLKFFNVYGPGEDHKGEMRSLVNKLIPVVAAGKPVQLFKSYHKDYADGDQKRDFVFVDDVVSTVIYFWKNANSSGIFNVGFGRARTWNDLVLAIFDAMQKKSDIQYVSMPSHVRDQYQYFTEANINKLKSVGYAVDQTNLEDGIRKYVKNYLSNTMLL